MIVTVQTGRNLVRDGNGRSAVVVAGAVLREGALDGNIMCRHLEILSVRSANLPAGEGVAFLGRNVANYNIGIEVVDISADYLSVNLVGYGVAVDSEGALDGNIMCGHLEILSVRSANLPAGEGVAFLSRNGSDCNIGIEDVGFSVTVILAVNLVGYVVLVDAELSIETNVLCRHGELAVSINSYDIRDIRPAGKGIAFLFRMSGSYGYVSAEGVGIDVAKLRFGTLLILIEVGYLEIVRNPLCIQMQAGHQNRSRIGGLASCVGVPTVKGVVFTSSQFGSCIAERRIFIAGGSGVNVGNIVAIVGMVSDSNVYILNVAVDMIAVSGVVLYGVPDNLSNLRVVIGAEQRSNVGCRSVGLICGIIGISRAVPVGRGEETEVGRRKQIVGVNAIGIEFALVSGLLARFGQMTIWVTGRANCTYYAAVRSLIRQIVSLALAFAVLRNAEVRQQNKVHSRGLGFRLDRGSRGISGPMSRQCQILVRHQSASLVLGIVLIEPAIEGMAFLFDFRHSDSLLGVNRTYGVTLARDCAAVFIIGQLMRIYVRLDINLDGSFNALCLGKVKTESVLAVFVFDRVAESGRLEFYMVDGVIGVIANLTDTNRRNLKGLVVPECPATSGLIGTVFVTALDVNLIGYAAAIRMQFLFRVNRPVGDVDLNHLRIFSANQIVEYQLVVPSECSPIGRILCTVL